MSDDDPRSADSRTPAKPADPILRWLVIGMIVCTAACALLIGLSGSQLVIATGIVFGGTAFVLVLAATFYAIGRGEDRERAARESGPSGPHS